MTLRTRFITLCMAAFAASPGAFASDYQSPRAAALGGSGHAGPMLNDALYLNPSFVSFLPAYSISGNYSFFKGEPHGHAVNASIQDGRSELFQAGAGLTLLEDRKVISLGASRSLVQRLGIGLGGKFVLPNVQSPSPIWDTVFSMTGVPYQWVQLSLVIDNLFESPEGRAYGLYREYVLGTKFNIQGIVLAYFDPHWAPHAPEGSFGHELGLEFPVMKDFFVRLGNFRNANVAFISTRARGYSAGVGWIAPRISFDYALQRVIAPVATTAHHLGFTIYF